MTRFRFQVRVAAIGHRKQIVSLNVRATRYTVGSAIRLLRRSWIISAGVDVKIVLGNTALRIEFDGGWNAKDLGIVGPQCQFLGRLPA